MPPSASATRGRVLLSSFTADLVGALPGSSWLGKRRAAAFERFSAAELPKEAEEVWRYSRIDELDLDRYRPLGSGPGAGDGVAEADTLPEALAEVLAALGPTSGLVLVRNGTLARVVLDPALAARGVRLEGLAGAVDGAEALGSVAGAPDALVELGNAFLVDGVLITVPASVQVAAPLVVAHWHDADGAAGFPRTVVRLGEGARASVVEVLASPDVAGLVVPVVELDVADAADLAYMGLQVAGPRVWQVAYQASRVGRDATLRSFTLALGGEYARLRSDSRLVGQGGTARLAAAYLGSGSQVHDFRTLQDHDAPRTTSDLVFKGAVKDSARSVYTGLIRVRKGAVGTNAFQTNRNLVLSEGARADSVPNLDIDENDVRCSHASAVGPIDEDQRYYLESRGVPPDEADRLIVLGFFDDLLQQAPVGGLHHHLRRAVAAKLGTRPLSAPTTEPAEPGLPGVAV